MKPDHRPTLMQSIVSALGQPVSADNAALAFVAVGVGMAAAMLIGLGAMTAANAHTVCALGF